MQNSLKIFKVRRDYICLHLNLAVSYVSSKSSFVLRWSTWTIEGILWWKSRKMLEIFHYFPSFFSYSPLAFFKWNPSLFALSTKKCLLIFQFSKFHGHVHHFSKKKHQIWKMCIAVPLTNERCENDGQTEVQNEHYLTESTKNRQMGGGRSGNHLGFRGWNHPLG